MKLHDITPPITDEVRNIAKWFHDAFGNVYTINWNPRANTISYQQDDNRPPNLIGPFYRDHWNRLGSTFTCDPCPIRITE